MTCSDTGRSRGSRLSPGRSPPNLRAMLPTPASTTTVPMTRRVRLFCRVPGGIEVIRRGRGGAEPIRLSFWRRLALRQERAPLPADVIHHNPQQVAIVPVLAPEVPFLLGHLGLK